MNKRKKAAVPLVMGTGLIALDVIVTAGESSAPRLCTGGTCGNVLLALQYLGCNAVPVGRLQNDDAARFILGELRGWGVQTAHLTLGEDGSTPVIVQTIRTEPGRPPTHTFSWRCPNCGARFPGYKPVLAPVAERIAAEMPAPAVFFFDRVNRGAIILASRAAELGAAVVFEPSGIGDVDLFREAWSLAHVVKYSHERLSDLPDEVEFGDHQVLQVETLGAEGLRYRARFGKAVATPWTDLDALPAPIVRDTAGAGDWCTAGLVSRLCRGGAKSLRAATPDELEEAIRFGQALAAWNCGFIGARGGMLAVDVEDCLDSVKRIQTGRWSESDRMKPARKDRQTKRPWCSSCADGHDAAEEHDPRAKRTTA